MVTADECREENLGSILALYRLIWLEKNRETADLKLFGGRLGAHSDRNNLAVLPGAIAGSISTAWGEISGVCK